MLLGTPWNHTISLKNKSTMLVASSILWHGIKCALFENLSTTTNIESLPRFNLCKPKTKSIEMSTHVSLGPGKGVYKPCGWVLDFAFLQVMHLSHMHYTSFFILGQQKCLCNKSKVLTTPKCPINLPSCSSHTSNSRIERNGTHKRFYWNKYILSLLNFLKAKVPQAL